MKSRAVVDGDDDDRVSIPSGLQARFKHSRCDASGKIYLLTDLTGSTSLFTTGALQGAPLSREASDKNSQTKSLDIDVCVWLCLSRYPCRGISI